MKAKKMSIENEVAKKIEDVQAWLANDANLSEQMQRIEDARRHVVMDHPFLGSKAMQAEVEFSTEIPTAATDGRKVLFNPMFTALLKFSFVLFTLIHEYLHIVLGHHVRRGNRNAKMWNIACDHVVNRVIKQFMRIPDDAYYSERFDDFSEEQIYSILAEEQRPADNVNPGEKTEEGEDEGEGGSSEGDDDDADDEGDDEGAGGCKADDEGGDEADDGEGDDDNGGGGTYELPDAKEWGEVKDMKNEDGSDMDDKEKSDERVNQVIESEKARRIGDAMGRGSGGSGFADKVGRAVKKSTYSWIEEIREFVSDSFQGDPTSTWDRGHRSHLANGIYLPGYKMEGVRDALVVADCSGSMWRELFTHALEETAKVINDANALSVDFLQFDDKVHEPIRTFEYGAEFNVETREGAGGTVFQPVLDWIEKSEKEYDFIIAITDMGICDFYTIEAPAAPIIWCDVYGHTYQKAPFGKTVVVTR
jgi:predicted metal-dependent peptidase